MKFYKIIYLVIMLIVLCNWAHIASAVPIISIEPTHIEVLEGNNFSVNITVDPDDTEVMGVQYRLSFDNNLLNAVDQRKGTFLSHDGISTMNIKNKINNTIGEAKYCEIRPGVSYGVNTFGILAIITFNATESGTCNLILDNVILTDTEAEEIPGVEVNVEPCNIVIVEEKSTSSSTETERKTSKTIINPASTPENTETLNITNTNQTTEWIEPQTTETALPISTLNQSNPSKENTEQSGYSLAFITIGLLILSYMILRKE